MKADELGLDFVEFREKESGKSISGRRMLQQAIQKAQKGDFIGFYDNSRIGRNTKESLEIVDDLINKGVSVQIAGMHKILSAAS